MKNIPTEAIRFNLFYDYSAPIREDGQEEQSPFLNRPSAPVTEETPQFKDIEIKNIFCLGAERAVKVLGLPEMTVKNIKFDNMVITANEGFIFVDTEDIVLKNINAEVKKGSLIACFNSKNILSDFLTVISRSSSSVTVSP